jgi:GNAT superfamily N-acetyltransferase
MLEAFPNADDLADAAAEAIETALQGALDARGRGIAKALLNHAERMALAQARTLLVLDTAADGGASALYEGVGFSLAGVIPDYSLKPQGGLTDVKYYWKQLGAHASQDRKTMR